MSILDPGQGLHESDKRPVLVVNMDTLRAGFFPKFENVVRERGEPDLARFEVLKVWAVDTCQMWLAGLGHILEEELEEGDWHDRSTIVQIPGNFETREQA